MKQLFVIPGQYLEEMRADPIAVKDRIDSLGSIVPVINNTMFDQKMDALSATQLGVKARVFVGMFSFNPNGKVGVFYSPEYKPGKRSRFYAKMEKCLNYRLQAWKVKRHSVIDAVWENHEGGVIKKRLRGKDARKFQKYTDMLDGRTPAVIAGEQGL